MEVFDVLLFYENNKDTTELIEFLRNLRKSSYQEYCIFIYKTLDFGRVTLWEQDYLYYKDKNLGWETGWCRIYRIYLSFIEVPCIKSKIRKDGLEELLS